MNRIRLLACIVVLALSATALGQVPSGETAQPLRTLDHDATVWSAILSPDGKLIAAGTSGHFIHLWDLASGNQVRSWPVTGGGVVCLSFSPDGKYLASAPGGGVEDRSLRLWEVATGKEVRRFEGHTAIVYGVAFSPDGKLLISASQDHSVRLWDVATGKEVALLGNHADVGLRAAFSPDNQMAATGGDDAMVRLWDVSARKAGPVLNHGGAIYCVAFSPDGRLLASAGYSGIKVWEVASGKELHTLAVPNEANSCWVAFSPDGMVLASGGNDHTVRLWDVLTGSELHRLPGHGGSVKSVAFSPDGKYLVSGTEDHKVLVWDVVGLAGGKRQPEDLTDARLRTLWNDLAGADAARAFEAGWVLALAPQQSVPFLQDHLKPAARPNAAAERIQRLIKDLDDDAFTVREQATRELEKLDDLAEPALRRALQGDPSLEVRMRIGQLLERLEQRTLQPERLQAVRGLGVLEKAATPEARQLLEKLSHGPEDDWLTQEARRVLARLNKRSDSQKNSP